MDLKDLLMMDIVGENMGRKTFLELNIPGLFSSPRRSPHTHTHTNRGILIQVCSYQQELLPVHLPSCSKLLGDKASAKI